MTKRFHNTSNTAVRLSLCFTLVTDSDLSGVRDWSLITGRRGGGGVQNGRGGGHMKFYPFLAILKGGGGHNAVA